MSNVATAFVLYGFPQSYSMPGMWHKEYIIKSLASIKYVVIVSSVSQCSIDPEEKQLTVNGFALGISQSIGPN